jgi:hypothetical protein
MAEPPAGIVHGSRASYIRYGCRCVACRNANTAYEREHQYIHALEQAACATGFLVPCPRCGNWRHMHQRPSPSKVWACWSRPCFDCRDGKGARSALVEQRARDGWAKRNIRMPNRQMVTGHERPGIRG